MHIHDDHHDHDEDEHYYDDHVMQSNQVVFLKHYLSMLDTCEHGLKYIVDTYRHQALDVQMVKDCIDALKAIDEANFLSWNIMKNIDRNAYNSIRSYDEFAPQIDDLSELVEVDPAKVYTLLAANFVKQYANWSQEVKNALQQYIV